MFTSFIITSNNIYYIRIARNRDLGRRKKMEEIFEDMWNDFEKLMEEAERIIKEGERR